MLVNRLLDSHSIEPLDFKGNKINFVDNFKLLGVVIDSKLCFDQHIAQLKKKVYFKGCLISRVRSIFPFAFRVTLFKLFVVPHFDYSSTVFSFSVSKTRLDAILKCFHRSLRTSLRYKVSSRLDLGAQLQLLKPLGLLPLKLRWFKRLCFLVFRSFRNGRPRALLNRYERVNRSREVRGESNRTFLVPRFSLEKYGRVSFLRITTILLNSFIFQYIFLPNDAVSSFTLFLNSNLLKTI